MQPRGDHHQPPLSQASCCRCHCHCHHPHPLLPLLGLHACHRTGSAPPQAPSMGNSNTANTHTGTDGQESRGVGAMWPRGGTVLPKPKPPTPLAKSLFRDGGACSHHTERVSHLSPRLYTHDAQPQVHKQHTYVMKPDRREGPAGRGATGSSSLANMTGAFFFVLLSRKSAAAASTSNPVPPPTHPPPWCGVWLPFCCPVEVPRVAHVRCSCGRCGWGALGSGPPALQVPGGCV